MKIYALNGMQDHSESVKRNVSLVGSVVLRGFETDSDIQLLEGSHRMAYAIELGLPITIVLFHENEIIPHDCDDVLSATTGLSDRSTAGELVQALLKERGLYHQAVYDSVDHTNVEIVRPIHETGEMLHARLIRSSPFSVFPEKVWVVTFGGLKDVVGKDVLVLGNPIVSDAFKKLNATVTFLNADTYQRMKNLMSTGDQFDLIYASDLGDEIDLMELFSCYKQLLKDTALAVTLSERQTPSIITAAGLNVYGFLKIQGLCPLASFAMQKG